MNERIKELADKSGLYIAYDNREVTDKELEFFAELIVRECGIVADQWVNDEDNGHNLVSDRLRQHFGVKL